MGGCLEPFDGAESTIKFETKTAHAASVVRITYLQTRGSVKLANRPCSPTAFCASSEVTLVFSPRLAVGKSRYAHAQNFRLRSFLRIAWFTVHQQYQQQGNCCELHISGDVCKSCYKETPLQTLTSWIWLIIKT